MDPHPNWMTAVWSRAQGAGGLGKWGYLCNQTPHPLASVQFSSVAQSCSTLLWLTGLQSTRLLCPWDFLEPDILECEVKWALESITTNKASGGDGIPVELFQILKDDAVKVLHSICQQIWKTHLFGPAVTPAPPPAFPRNPRGRLGFPGPTQGEGCLWPLLSFPNLLAN